MNIIFTDYDTVKIGNDREITTQKFFEYFAKAIEYDKITNCNYTPKSEEFSFIYDNEKYIVKITKKSLDKLRKLLSLMKIEQNKSNKRQKADITKNENEELLKLARNGEIVSETAKELYLKELKSEIKLSDIFKEIELQDIAYDFFHLDASDTKKWAEVISPILAIISFISVIGSMILQFSEIIKITPALIMSGVGFVEFFVCLATLDSGGSLLARALTYISWGIINLVGNLIKINIDLVRAISKLISKVSLIKHKIKSLKNYNVPSEELVLPQKNEEKSNDVLTSYIAKYIDNIYLNLLKLNDEDKREMRKELENKLKKYQLSLSSLPQSGLTLETETTVNTRFIMDLADLELKINQKLNSELKNKLITSSIERINEETENKEENDDKTKKRVLQI